MQFAQLLAAFEVLQDRCEEVLGQYILHKVPQGLTPEVWWFRHFGCQELHCLSHLQNGHSISMAKSFLGSQGQETCWPRTAFLWQCPFCAAKVRKPAGQGQRFYGNVLFVQPRSGNQLAKNIILMAIPFLCSQSHEAGRSRTTFLWQRHFCTTKVMTIGTATPPRKNPSTITWHTLPPITHPLLQNWRGNGCVWQLSRLEGHKMNTSD